MDDVSFADVCRLCLWKDSRLINIFDSHEHLNVAAKIQKCLPITVTRTDFLPKVVCGRCIFKLDMLHEFWETCLRTQKILLSYITECRELNRIPTTQGLLRVSIKNERQSQPETCVIDGSGSEEDPLSTQDTPGDEPIPLPPVTTVAANPVLSDSGTSSEPSDRSSSRVELNESQERHMNNSSMLSDHAKPKISSTPSPRVSYATRGSFGSLLLKKKEADPFSNEFCCQLCDKRFGSVRAVKIHTSKHNFKCEICKKIFPSRHGVSVHRGHCKANRLRKFSCKKCDKTFFTETKLHFHMKKSHLVKPKNDKRSERKEYTCHVCSKKFIYYARLQQHLQGHGKSFECKICKKTYGSEWWLVYHNRKFHNKRAVTSPKLKWSQTNDGVLGFNDGGDLHVKEEKATEAENATKNSSVDSKDGVTCTTCGKKLTSLRTLLIHEKTHKQDKIYKCSVCGEGFRWIASLQAHQRSHNKLEVPCKLCSRKFLSVIALQSHMKFHTNAFDKKQFKCRLCDDVFHSHAALMVHVAGHTENLEFRCQMCEKRFRKKNHLVLHIKMGHPKQEQDLIY